MRKEKSYRERLIDSFTKTRGQIYDEYSKSEKIGYWIFIGLVAAVIAIVAFS
jgi:hypothetical protein